MARKRTSIGIDDSQFVALMQTIEKLSPEVSKHVRRTAMPEAVGLTERRMRATSPEGKQKDRDKQSKSHKQKWAGTPKLKDAIGGVIRDYDVSAFTAFVGVEFPWGNKSYFDYHGKKSRQVFAWGKDMQRKKRKRRWMVEVMDNVGPQIIRLFEKAIADGVALHMKGAR